MTDDRIWHPYTRYSAMDAGPLPTIVRGEGVYLFDEEGNRYFDAISSWWSCALGHGHPAIVDAIQSQAGTLQHSILGNLSHPMALALASKLDQLAGGNRHVHFASDGAAAIEIALKVCIQYHHQTGHPEKHSFVSLSDPYHGDTLGAVSVGYMEDFHRAFRPVLFPTFTAKAPSCISCEYGVQSCDVSCADDIENVIRRNAAELAGVIVEPLCQGAAGMRMYSPECLARIQRLCTEVEVPLILDEVATGFCKTGSMFAFERAGIQPDLLCVGKSLSAGSLPISAAIVRDQYYDTFTDLPEDNTLYHGHTFAGNPIAAAASLAALRVYEEEDLAARAREMESVFRNALAEAATLEAVKETRFLGAIAAVEIDSAAVQGEGSGVMNQLRSRLMAQEVLIRPLGNVVYFIPPLVTPDELLADACGKLISAIEEFVTQRDR